MDGPFTLDRASLRPVPAQPGQVARRSTQCRDGCVLAEPPRLARKIGPSVFQAMIALGARFRQSTCVVCFLDLVRRRAGQLLAPHFERDGASIRSAVSHLRTTHRLGLALQIVTARFLGTFLPDPTDVPAGRHCAHCWPARPVRDD